MRTPNAVLPPSLTPVLHEALVDLASAVQRRAIYPAGHPVLRGAVAGVCERLSACFAESHTLEIGVAERRILAGGGESDASHPHLGELAARLAAHRVGGLRISAGVTEEEVGALVDAIATPPDGTDQPLGRRGDLQWAQIRVEPISFSRLGLLDGAAGADEGASAAAWRALAAGAFASDSGDLVDPGHLARALVADDEGSDALRAQFEELLLSGMGEGRGIPSGVQGQVVALMDALGVPGLTRVLAGVGVERTGQLVQGAVGFLPTGAVVNLVQAAAAANARVISTSLLRLLQKVGGGGRASGASSRVGDRLLQLAIRRLLHEWTLDNPNPAAYEQALTAVANPRERGVDLRRDQVEPERLVDLALEVGDIGSAVEAALGRLALRDGLVATLTLLHAYPASDIRERLIDRLINESTLREHLAQPTLDLPFLRSAIDRVHGRAAVPLLEALDRRPEADAASLAELLLRIGWDVLEPIGARVAQLTPRVLRSLVPIFDALDAWPPGIDPIAWLTHNDFVVRRETIKHLLKSSSTREAALQASLRDHDVRIVAIGLHALATACTPSSAREVMRRYTDPGFTTELRVRAIRAAAASHAPDVAAWLIGMVRKRRSWFRAGGLQKPSPETVAAVGAMAQWFSRHAAATEVLDLARASRHPEYRRAASAAGAAPNA